MITKTHSLCTCALVGLVAATGLRADLASVNFNAGPAILAERFTEQNLTVGTTFSHSSTIGISGGGGLNIGSSIDCLRYDLPLAGFLALDTGYTVRTCFKARSRTIGTPANLVFALALLPSSSDQFQGSGSNAYLQTQIAALATASGQPSQFQLNFRSRNGTTESSSNASAIFNMTDGNWHRLSTTFKRVATDRFAVVSTMEDCGPAGVSAPVPVVTYTGNYLVNPRFSGASELYVAMKTGKHETGVSALDDFGVSPFPEPATATRPFPADAGIVNVKAPPYNAKGDGVTDDTLAIQQAISANTGIIYFPNGIYKVGNRLEFKTTANVWACFRTLQGESRDGVVIKLGNQCPGYTDTANPRAVIYTASQNASDANGSGDQGFMNSICNLTVDVGSGNPGAIGIDYLASNQGVVRDVLVRTSDPGKAGKYGIALSRATSGPCLLKNVEVVGFQIGIKTGGSTLVNTLENIRLSGQTDVGLHNENLVLAVRNLSSSNTVTAIRDVATGVYGAAGLIVLDQAELQGGGAANRAIDSAGNLFLRDVNTGGYQANPLVSRGVAFVGPSYPEFVSLPAKTFANTTPQSLRLPVEETPVAWDANLTRWVSTGAPNGVDDTARIQGVIDGAAPGSTLYFPYGIYKVSNTITVRNNISHIVGMMSQIQVTSTSTFTDANNPKPVFRFATPATDIAAQVMENLWIRMAGVSGAIAFEHASAKPVVLKNLMIYCGGGAYRNTSGAGKLFMEDIGAHGQTRERFFLDYPQQVWARQLDIEANSFTPYIRNQGGALWILGFKTEHTGPFLETIGGQSEILGAYHWINDASLAASSVAYINTDSDVSLSMATNIKANCLDYGTYVSETRGATSNILFRTDTYGRYGSPSNTARVIPIFSSYSE